MVDSPHGKGVTFTIRSAPVGYAAEYLTCGSLVAIPMGFSLHMFMRVLYHICISIPSGGRSVLPTFWNIWYNCLIKLNALLFVLANTSTFQRTTDCERDVAMYFAASRLWDVVRP